MTQRLAIALTAINLMLLFVSGAQRPSASAEAVAPILRGHAIELGDDRGEVRSRLNVEQTGEVGLRLLDEHGTIRVKLGAGQDGSGLLLADEGTEAVSTSSPGPRPRPSDRRPPASPSGARAARNESP